jgi:sulfur-oxidizing protein SoxX
MKKSLKQIALVLAILFSSSIAVSALDLTKAYDMPDASKLIEKDLLQPPKKFTMPKSCKLDDADAIARGEYIFHNLNGKKAKKAPPKGLVKFIEKKGKDGKVKKVPKQFGNCVACHNIEGAVGGGNIGPDLTGYKAIFVDSKTRDANFVYQKIADPRIDNPKTHMTVNLTTKLFNESEICDLTAYVMSDKSAKK